MPYRDDTQRNRRNGRDLASEWQRIVGTPYEPDKWPSYVHPDDLPRILSATHRAYTTGYFLEEYRLRTVSGEYAHVRATAQKIAGKWRHRMVRLDPDHPHQCAGVHCYCGQFSPPE